MEKKKAIKTKTFSKAEKILFQIIFDPTLNGKSYFHLNIFLQYWKLKRVSKQRVASKLPRFIISRSKTTKANKNPPVPFNCTFYVIAMHSISFVLNMPPLISLCFLAVSKSTPSTGAGTKASKHTDTRIPDSRIKNCFQNFCIFRSYGCIFGRSSC